jgi:hypothetical protein
MSTIARSSTLCITSSKTSLGRDRSNPTRRNPFWACPRGRRIDCSSPGSCRRFFSDFSILRVAGSGVSPVSPHLCFPASLRESGRLEIFFSGMGGSVAIGTDSATSGIGLSADGLGVYFSTKECGSTSLVDGDSTSSWFGEFVEESRMNEGFAIVGLAIPVAGIGTYRLASALLIVRPSTPRFTTFILRP